MTTSSEPEQLLARVALRDRQAFKQLYDGQAAHLLGVALRILKRRDLAEEALQDAFIQIWQRAGEYRADRAKASTWMHSIVRYRALDLLRKHQREVPLEDELLAGAAAESSGDDLSRAEERALQRCLEKLQDIQRQCITLSFVEGYSHEELVRRLGQPLGTIKSWVRRGLQQLKTCLQS